MAWSIPEEGSSVVWQEPESEFIIPGFGAGGFGEAYFSDQLWLEPSEKESSTTWTKVE